jgi:hypothetical protein
VNDRAAQAASSNGDVLDRDVPNREMRNRDMPNRDTLVNFPNASEKSSLHRNLRNWPARGNVLLEEIFPRPV